jgi:DNA-binding transcriptional MocR family regulator
MFFSDNIFITAGATQGLHLATTVLMSLDSPIFVEDPSYFLAIGMFREDFRYPVIPGNLF